MSTAVCWQRSGPTRRGKESEHVCPGGNGFFKAMLTFLISSGSKLPVQQEVVRHGMTNHDRLREARFTDRSELIFGNVAKAWINHRKRTNLTPHTFRSRREKQHQQRLPQPGTSGERRWSSQTAPTQTSGCSWGEVETRCPGGARGHGTAGADRLTSSTDPSCRSKPNRHGPAAQGVRDDRLSRFAGGQRLGPDTFTDRCQSQSSVYRLSLLQVGDQPHRRRQAKGRIKEGQASNCLRKPNFVLSCC